MAAAGKKTSDSQLEPADYPQDTTDAVKCRYVFGLLGFLGMAILYSLRVNLSVAIVTMVNSTGSDSTDVMDSDGTCEAPDSDGSSSSSQSGEFEWNEEMQGFVLSGFFWGYAAGQLPGGLLAERYGGKLVFGLGVFLTALLTLLTAVAAHAHWSVLFAVRVLEGLAESVTFPAAQAMIAKKLPVPWKKILTTRGLWACASMHLGIGWTFFALLTCLPTYMSYILHYDIKSNAALSAIPYIAGGSFSFVFSWCLDHIITTGKVSKINGYRIFNGITAIGPAATLLIITAVGCDKVAILVLLAINGLCLGAQYTGNSMNLLTLAPNFAGTMLGISNTFANGAGILAPYAVGFLTNDNQTRTAWNIVFWISAAIGLVTYFIYLIFSTADEQPWNNPPDVSGESGKHKSLQGVDNKAYE
ncbi:Putative sodium-dependent phosphate transporter [Gryllus bimaculatus]|nr:Putative sodium-dependent phosphate transporter [Gryllus bimaculatus]